MPPQAPWSPTAQAFAYHQFSHVANFWKQGRQASFRLEVLSGGQAELHLTFQLPPSSEVIPPPTPVAPQHCSLVDLSPKPRQNVQHQNFHLDGASLSSNR